MDLDLDRIVAIDVHTHAEVGRTGEDGLLPEWREAAQRYFGEGGTPTVEEVAAYYRERNMLAVVFTVDAETVTGRAAVRNEEIREVDAAKAAAKGLPAGDGGTAVAVEEVVEERRPAQRQQPKKQSRQQRRVQAPKNPSPSGDSTDQGENS